MRKVLTIVSLVAAAAVAAAERKPFTVVEASIPEMQKAMREKRVTSRELVQQYLTRIALYDGKLHATISVKPNALKEAEELDRVRVRGRLLGPLHGTQTVRTDILQANYLS